MLFTKRIPKAKLCKEDSFDIPNAVDGEDDMDEAGLTEPARSRDGQETTHWSDTRTSGSDSDTKFVTRSVFLLRVGSQLSLNTRIRIKALFRHRNFFQCFGQIVNN